MTRFTMLFFIGAFGYGFLELLWRGHTHWTMFVLGGLCMYTLFTVFTHMEHSSIFTKAIVGGFIITAAEFLTGCIINLLLHWNVWSYASSPFNILGQVCLPYSVLWAVLSVPIAYLCEALKKFI